MKKGSSIIITFGGMQLETTDGSKSTKKLANKQCQFDRETIYLASGSYTTKWKHVEELEISGDCTLRLFDKRNHRKVELSNPMETKSWERLKKTVTKKSKKSSDNDVNNNTDNNVGREPKPRSRAGSRSTYGSRNRRISQKQRDYDAVWNGDEDDYDDVLDPKKDNDNPKIDNSTMDSSPPEIVVEEDDYDSNYDGDNILSTKKTPKPTTRKRLKQQIMTNSDDDTDDEFPLVQMTTPAAQRAVSPEMEDNREEMKENEEDDRGEEDEGGEGEEDTPPTIKTAKISNYFLPRLSTSKDDKKTPTVVEPSTKTKTSRTSSSATKTYSATPKATNSTTPGRFFSSPARPKKVGSLPDGTPTQTPPGQNAHRMINPTKRKNRSSEMARGGDKSDEEEIEEIDTIEGNSSSPQRSRLVESKGIGKRARLSYQPVSALTTFGPRGLSSSRCKQRITMFGESTESPSLSPYRGFRNDGNSCYMNASLQMLYSAEPFISALEGKGGELVKSVVAKAHDVQTISSLPADASLVKEKMDKLSDKFHGDAQQDAHEFVADLIDHIHEELAESENSNSEVPQIDVVDDSKNNDLVLKGSAKDEDDDTETNKVDGIKGLAATINSEPEDPARVALAGNMSCVPDSTEVTVTAATEKAKESLPTDEYFRCDIEMCLTCNSCGYARTRMEVFRHLSLGVEAPPDTEGKISIKSSFENFFKPEVLDLKCEKCEDDQTASQVMKLVNRPKAILLHLKRFVIDQQKNANNQGHHLVFRKNKAPVEISKQLSLKTVSAGKAGDSDSKAGNSGQYSLVSIVTHVGQRASSGHYTAEALRRRPLQRSYNGVEKDHQVLDNTSEKEWVQYDDSKTEITSLEEVLSNGSCQKNAYMLLYILD